MLEGGGTELRGRGRSGRDQETGTLHHSHPKTASTSSAPLHSKTQLHLEPAQREKEQTLRLYDKDIDSRDLCTVEIMVVI